MFDEAGLDREKARPSLMRALIIASNPHIQSMWRRVLKQEGFETVEAKDSIAALHLSSPHGIDLIVLAGEPGAISAAEFLDLVGRGLYGPVAPPVIVQRPIATDVWLKAHGALAAVVNTEVADDQDCFAAIERAFAVASNFYVGKGEHHA